MPLVAALRNGLRAELLGREQRGDPRRAPWEEGQRIPTGGYARACVICGWHGHIFEREGHCEGATCPGCGGVARDRFMYHCFVTRVPFRRGMRVLETSPRLGAEYRRSMAGRCAYLSSDFDLRAHRADVALDPQRLALASGSLDVVLTAHVLSVPVLQGRTAPPTEPEYHDDNTLVYWRFGMDLTQRLRDHGFQTALLVPAEFKQATSGKACTWPTSSPEFDVTSILAGAIPGDMEAVASARVSRRMGFQPAYMFAVWECVTP